MAMPKATMHENRLTSRGKDKVWGAWQIAAVKTVSVTESVHQTANPHLWLGIPRADARHALGAVRGA